MASAMRVAVVKSGWCSARLSVSFWFRLKGISFSTSAPCTTRPTVVKFFCTLSPLFAPTVKPPVLTGPWPTA